MSKTEILENAIDREFPVQPDKYYIFPPFAPPKGFTLEEAMGSLRLNPFNIYIENKVQKTRLPHRYYHGLKRNIIKNPSTVGKVNKGRGAPRRNKRFSVFGRLFHSRSTAPPQNSSSSHKIVDPLQRETMRRYFALFPILNQDNNQDGHSLNKSSSNVSLLNSEAWSFLDDVQNMDLNDTSDYLPAPDSENSPELELNDTAPLPIVPLSYVLNATKLKESTPHSEKSKDVSAAMLILKNILSGSTSPSFVNTTPLVKNTSVPNETDWSVHRKIIKRMLRNDHYNTAMKNVVISSSQANAKRDTGINLKMFKHLNILNILPNLKGTYSTGAENNTTTLPLSDQPSTEGSQNIETSKSFSQKLKDKINKILTLNLFRKQGSKVIFQPKYPYGVTDSYPGLPFTLTNLNETNLTFEQILTEYAKYLMKQDELAITASKMVLLPEYPTIPPDLDADDFEDVDTTISLDVTENSEEVLNDRPNNGETTLETDSEDSEFTHDNETTFYTLDSEDTSDSSLEIYEDFLDLNNDKKTPKKQDEALSHNRSSKFDAVLEYVNDVMISTGK
nr:uncharacterized protein LOC106689804 [Halyomorpha halys]